MAGSSFSLCALGFGMAGSSISPRALGFGMAGSSFSPRALGFDMAGSSFSPRALGFGMAGVASHLVHWGLVWRGAASRRPGAASFSSCPHSHPRSAHHLAPVPQTAEV